MRIIKWKIGDNKPIVEDQLAVAIGNFDGIHQGHVKLLNECKFQAKENDLSFGVVTFDPHPRDFFNPKNSSFKLLDNEKSEFSNSIKGGLTILYLLSSIICIKSETILNSLNARSGKLSLKPSGNK